MKHDVLIMPAAEGELEQACPIEDRSFPFAEPELDAHNAETRSSQPVLQLAATREWGQYDHEP